MREVSGPESQPYPHLSGFFTTALAGRHLGVTSRQQQLTIRRLVSAEPMTTLDRQSAEDLLARLVEMFGALLDHSAETCPTKTGPCLRKGCLL